MSGYDLAPTFNIKAVVQATGLKPDTLRAWERRYGLPQPRRSEGGHRIFCQRDIDTLKWLVARQGEGMSIRRAVDLWRQLEVEGRDPLQLRGVGLGEAPSRSLAVPAGDEIVTMREGWIAACLAFDERSAEGALVQAFALYPLDVVCTQVLQAGLAEIGQRWYAGEVSVQQEHFASALAMRRLEVLLAATQLPSRVGRVVLACPPGEEHVFSLLLLTSMLRRRGGDAVYLGANVPLDRMEATLRKTGPRLLVSAAQTLQSAASLLDLARLLQRAGTPMAYGGRVFNGQPRLQARIPGHFLGESIDEGLGTIDGLLASHPIIPAVEETPRYALEAIDHFRERLPHLEAEAASAIGPSLISRKHLATANAFLADHIIAALRLGDLTFLSPEITWVRGMLPGMGIPPAHLAEYLRVYRQAARAHLGTRSAPILAWLEQAV